MSEGTRLELCFWAVFGVSVIGLILTLPSNLNGLAMLSIFGLAISAYMMGMIAAVRIQSEGR